MNDEDIQMRFKKGDKVLVEGAIGTILKPGEITSIVQSERPKGIIRTECWTNGFLVPMENCVGEMEQLTREIDLLKVGCNKFVKVDKHYFFYCGDMGNHYCPDCKLKIDLRKHFLKQLRDFCNKMDDKDFKLIEAMEIYGGSFVKKLASLWHSADEDNKIKIRETWSNYFDDYRKFIK